MVVIGSYFYYYSYLLLIFRYSKFTNEEHQKLRALLWILAKEDPTRKILDYVNELQMYGFNVKREFVRLIFNTWKWSWKRPSFKQLQKYTQIILVYN